MTCHFTLTRRNLVILAIIIIIIVIVTIIDTVIVQARSCRKSSNPWFRVALPPCSKSRRNSTGSLPYDCRFIPSLSVIATMCLLIYFCYGTSVLSCLHAMGETTHTFLYSVNKVAVEYTYWSDLSMYS